MSESIIPDGWERVEFNKDTVIQEGWKFYSFEKTWRLTKCAGETMAEYEIFTYIRPIVKPASPAIHCPSCGKPMVADIPRKVRCGNVNCELCGKSFTPAFIARVKVEPDPIVCPVCGHSASVSGGAGCFSVGCNNNSCLMMGPDRPTEQEAVEAFRKLEYRK